MASDFDQDDKMFPTEAIYESLRKAADIGNLPAIKKIMSGYTIDVNNKDFQGWTPLMCAALGGHKETAQYLISQGALLDEQDDQGETALIKAALFNNGEMVSLLLQRGANLDIVDNIQNSALHSAKSLNAGDAVSAIAAWIENKELLTTVKDTENNEVMSF